MSSFTENLTLTKIVTDPLKKKFLWIIPYRAVNHYWVTDREFSYHVGDKNSNHIITVPVGFRTDLTSIPRIFRGFFSVDGSYTQGAVLHDFLYNRKGKSLGINNTDLSRGECDNIFLETMKVLGVSVFQRYPIYGALVIAGWYSWEKN